GRGGRAMRDRCNAGRGLRPGRRGAGLALAVMTAVLGTSWAACAQTTVDLQLALMVDASGSVNTYRFELQKRGYVEALRNPHVLGAIQGGRTQSIAISLVQWTGPFLQGVVLPWRPVKDWASIGTRAAI